MHSLSLIALLLVCTHCAPSGPVYRGLRVDLSVRAPVRVEVDARVQARAPAEVEVEVPAPAPAEVEVEVEAPAPAPAEVEVQVQAPPPPPTAVALEGAPVVEFFGVPLEGVQDVVFVLDRSGSMSEPAHGRIARIAAAAPAGQPATSAPGDPFDDQLADQPADQPVADQPADYPVADQPIAEQPVDPSADQPADPLAEQPVDPSAQPTVVSIVPRKIDVAQAELIDALERLPAGTRMNVVFFNSGVEAAAPGIVPLEESSREELIQYVRETIPDGRTALAPAMRAAFLMNARRVVLLSDGLGNLGGDAQDVIRDAREAMRGGARIDTIGLGGNQDTRLLQILARESGGLYQPL